MGYGGLLLLRARLWMVAVVSWWAMDGALDGRSSFLYGSGWLLLFFGALWMDVVVVSRWALDDCCCFLLGSRWFMIVLGGLQMVAVISLRALMVALGGL